MLPQEREWFERLKDLALRAVAGDEQAAQHLYDEYNPSLRRIVAYYLNARVRALADVDDVAQDAWKSWFRRLRAGDINSPQALVACLREPGIHKVQKANRHYLDAAKRDVRRQASIDDLGPGEHASLTDPVPTPAQVAGARDWARQLLCRLPDDLRRVVLLRAEGRTNAEVAGILGVSERTVKRMFEAARAVAARLGGEA